MNHECYRCIAERIIRVATVLLVGGCIEEGHIEERWMCDEHWGKLQLGCLRRGDKPYCATCHKARQYNQWADYLVKIL